MNLYSEVVFPRLFEFVITHQGFESHRKALLNGVRGAILEVGIGTGLNLEYYPSWVKKLTAVEPNAGMREQLWKRTSDHRIEVECYDARAEALPFAAATFDTVVSTFTLCSFDDLQASLAEIKRV